MKKISIGEKIEQYVDYLGYTDEELKEVFNFDSKNLISIYNNEYIPNKEEQKKFANLFNINEEELSNGLSIDEIAMNEEFLERQKTLPNLPEQDVKQLAQFGIYLKKRIR